MRIRCPKKDNQSSLGANHPLPPSGRSEIRDQRSEIRGQRSGRCFALLQLPTPNSQLPNSSTPNSQLPTPSSPFHSLPSTFTPRTTLGLHCVLYARYPLRYPSHTSNTLIQAELPPELAIRARSYVEEGWASDFNELLTEALRRFLESHSTRVTESFVMADLNWGLLGND